MALPRRLTDLTLCANVQSPDAYSVCSKVIAIQIWCAPGSGRFPPLPQLPRLRSSQAVWCHLMFRAAPVYCRCEMSSTNPPTRPPGHGNSLAPAPGQSWATRRQSRRRQPANHTRYHSAITITRDGLTFAFTASRNLAMSNSSHGCFKRKSP